MEMSINYDRRRKTFIYLDKVLDPKGDTLPLLERYKGIRLTEETPVRYLTLAGDVKFRIYQSGSLLITDTVRQRNYITGDYRTTEVMDDMLHCVTMLRCHDQALSIFSKATMEYPNKLLHIRGNREGLAKKPGWLYTINMKW